MTPAQFFAADRSGRRVRFDSDAKIYRVHSLTRGTSARVSLEGAHSIIFIYLSGTLVRFEDLGGPSHTNVHLVK